jgi:predicted dehydrogenase
MSRFDPLSLRQSWPMPARPRPVVVFGAGSIVTDGHLPAYRQAGFPVAGIYDIDRGRAEAVARTWKLPKVYDSPEEAAGEPGAVFDLATPPAAHLGLLRALPEGATVLLQKPMGRDLGQATGILKLCRGKSFTAAVNFQMRFSSMMLALKDAVDRGLLGRLVDIEVHLNLVTPWHMFAFLNGLPRIEITMHSIHYLDFIRSLLGNPTGVHARTLGHPNSTMAQTRTSAILGFGDDVRCTLSINHDHDFGRKFQAASLRVEGDKGAAVCHLGLLLDYPKGEPDELWITAGRADGWSQIPLRAGWFPDAFAGRMANLQRAASGEDAMLAASVEDGWHTMALVEACFRSSAAPMTPVPSAP